MIETCAIRIRDGATGPLSSALAELLSEEGEASRKVEGHVLQHADGEWIELLQQAGRATQFSSWLAQRLGLPLLVIIASLDDVAYMREADDADADDADEPLPVGMAQVVYLHVEPSGKLDDRSAQYDPESEEFYSAGDAWETVRSMLRYCLPDSGLSQVASVDGYLPSSGVPERLELLCSLIASAGSYGVRNVGGATMVSVEVAGARRFERIEDGDLELIREATGTSPS